MLSIVTTSDGSPTIRNSLTGDTYHSIHGAVQESQHVFIKHGLEYFMQTFSKEKINILEVGLGTALNALLTFKFAKNQNLKVEYVGLEAYPLDKVLYCRLDYGSDNDILLQFHECEWEKPLSISPDFTFTKHLSKMQLIELDRHQFDLVYYDAFAPNSQPEMWTKDILQKVTLAMKRPSVFVTYCAKGQVKRDMKEIGLSVENPDGPPGKRSMLRAMKV